MEYIEVFIPQRRVDAFQMMIVSGAEKGEWGDDAAGADAGDDVEVRPVAACAPAAQHAGCICAVRAASGKAQNRPFSTDRLLARLSESGFRGRDFVADLVGFLGFKLRRDVDEIVRMEAGFSGRRQT